MTVECPRCHNPYDDAKCWTYCPHQRFISDKAAAQKDAAFKLLGQWVRFNHQDKPERYLITAVMGDGMVTLDTLPGEFAPELFVVLGSGETTV